MDLTDARLVLLAQHFGHRAGAIGVSGSAIRTATSICSVLVCQSATSSKKSGVPFSQPRLTMRVTVRNAGGDEAS